jgi:succinoglycan biosynthesis transport protein ExoP
MDLSIQDIISLIKKRFLFITIVTLMGLIIAYAVTKLAVKPTYSASVQLYVNTKDTTSSLDLNDLYYAQKVVTTYINFLNTKVFYSQVIEESGLSYTPGELRSLTEIHSVNNTEIFQISVTTNSADDSYKLVLAMQKLAPELIKGIKTAAEISVVDPVTYPTSPSGPNLLLKTAIGGLFGLFFSVFIVFAWEILDVRLKNEEELKKKYHKPILGIIPHYGNHKMQKTVFHRIYSKIRRKTSKNYITIQDETNFLITEAYKELRTNLRYSLSREGCKRILINSPIPQDGKSTVSKNLSVSIAQTGAKVLLIDCDMRKGRLHRLFNTNNYPGLSELLIGLVKEEEAIQRTGYDNLQIISMGQMPPNPTELLSDGRMEEVLNSIEHKYDYIIIDSPPINVVSDALSLIKLVDGVVLVVRENFTTHGNIANAIAKLRFVEANIMGFVLNGVSVKRRSKPDYKYYRNYYHPRSD